MYKKSIKRYILPVFLSFACVLTGCSQSNNNNNGNNTTQEEENPTIEGTWKVKDFSETAQKIIIDSGGSEERAQALKDYYGNIDLKLTIKDKNVELNSRLDVKDLYEADFKRSGYKRYKDIEQFTKSRETMFKLSQKKLTHTESSFENNIINLKLKDGVLDSDKQTISFPETPTIDGLYTLGIETEKLEKDPITFNYKIEGKELVLTVSGKNRKNKDQTVIIKFTKEKNK